VAGSNVVGWVATFVYAFTRRVVGKRLHFSTWRDESTRRQLGQRGQLANLAGVVRRAAVSAQNGAETATMRLLGDQA
jgi:hypothetical protein